MISVSLSTFLAFHDIKILFADISLANINSILDTCIENDY